MDFDEFQSNFKGGALKKDTYAFDTERDFWEWEEAETLKKHYKTLAEQWT